MHACTRSCTHPLSRAVHQVPKDVLVARLLARLAAPLLKHSTLGEAQMLAKVGLALLVALCIPPVHSQPMTTSGRCSLK